MGFRVDIGLLFSPENTWRECYFAKKGLSDFFRAFSQLRLEKLVWLAPVSGQVDGVEGELCMSIFQKHGPEACFGLADLLTFDVFCHFWVWAY